MRKQWLRVLGIAGAAFVAGCSDDTLTVPNPNQPSVESVTSTPAGIEQLIGLSYQQIHNGLYGSSDALWPQVMNTANENYGSVANFGMALRSGIPRVPIDNNRGNATLVGNFRDFSQMSRLGRSTSSAIRALDALPAGLATAGQTARARAFGFFSVGLTLGNLALMYDSAAIVTPAVAPPASPTDPVPDLSAYPAVMAAAIQMLDTAIAVANAVPADQVGNFAIPAAWLAQGGATSRDNFVRIARSYRARFRAGVARTPTERAAVDWSLVIADATNGITSNFTLNLSPTTGWFNAFLNQFMVYQGWHQMPYTYYGMADTSGNYLTWLNQPLTGKQAFLVLTPDRRWPSGTTRTAQNRGGSTAQVQPAAGQYFHNRAPGDDTPGDAWANSNYDHFRFIAFRQGASNGPWPTMTKAEIDLLAAEGYLRTGNAAAAIPLINNSRTAAGLPAIPATAALTDVVPGGTGCVPRVPVPSASTTQMAGGYTTVCGDLMEAMKYEKRMETAFTGYGQWFVDGRGWGDLPQGSTLQWPVPFQEMDARLRPFYNSNVSKVVGGGPVTVSVAPRGTYAF